MAALRRPRLLRSAEVALEYELSRVVLPALSLDDAIGRFTEAAYGERLS